MVQIITVYGSLLLRAMGYTMLLALWGLLFGTLLGLVFGLLGVVRNKVCNTIQILYVNIVRGVPMVVLAMFVFFGVPYAFNNILGHSITMSALQAGTICLALNCGAYMAEIIRAGIQSVDKGQMEAARSLGLPLLAGDAAGRAAPGHSHHDPHHCQPVHYYAEGYVDPFHHRVPRAGQHSEKRGGEYLYVLPDLGHCGCDVFDHHYPAVHGCEVA